MKLNYVKLTQGNWGDFLYVGQAVSHRFTQKKRGYNGNFPVCVGGGV